MARKFAGLGSLALLASACLDVAGTEASSSGGKGGTGGAQLGGAAGWPGSGGAGGASATGGSEAGDDGAADASDDESVADAGPPCDLLKPFGAPVPVGELNTSEGEGYATLTHDELTVYFQASSSAGADGAVDVNLMTAKRASKTAQFGQPTPLTNVNTASWEVDPSPTADNCTLYFCSNRAGGQGGFDLWSVTRASPAADFVNANASNVTALNTPGWDFAPYVMADGLTLYFTSEPTPGQEDLFRATRTLTTSFALDTSGVFNLVNTSDIEDFPVVTADELTLYFTSNRAGGMPTGALWKAERKNTSQPFGSSVNVSELNTPGYQNASWISDDGCRIYLSISGDLYVATKPAS